MTALARTLCIGTRKGLFTVRRNGVGWALDTPHFPGEPVTQFACDPADGAWYAALRLGHFGIKLRKSTDQGVSWQEVAAPAFPPKPADGPWKDDPTPWTVDLLWGLEAGPGRLSTACGTGRTARSGWAAATTMPASTPSWWTRATLST
jgi:hypothetical protein